MVVPTKDQIEKVWEELVENHKDNTCKDNCIEIREPFATSLVLRHMVARLIRFAEKHLVPGEEIDVKKHVELWKDFAITICSAYQLGVLASDEAQTEQLSNPDIDLNSTSPITREMEALIIVALMKKIGLQSIVIPFEQLQKISACMVRFESMGENMTLTYRTVDTVLNELSEKGPVS